MVFDNPIDETIAEAIKTLEAQCKSGEVVIEGRRDDILTRALKKSEHGGHVYAVGSGVTIREYFGSNNPTPPSQLRKELTSLHGKMEVMQNTQNLMMSFMMNILNQDQMSQFMASVGGAQLGDFNGKMGGIGAQLGGGSNQSGRNGNLGLSGAKDIGLTGLGDEGHFSFSELLTRGVFDSSHKLGKGSKDTEGNNISNVPSYPDVIEQDVEPYRVPRPETEHVQHEAHEFRESDLCRFKVQETTPTNINCSRFPEHIFPRGWSDCCLSIFINTEVEIVALGRVYIPTDKETIVMGDGNLPQDQRQVLITEDIDPTASLPCPTEEMTYVCQAKEAYVAWPSHLIFPRSKFEKKQAKQVNTEPTPSPSSFQASTTRKYIINEKDRAKLTTGLVIALKSAAVRMKKDNNALKVEIPDNVYCNRQHVVLDYEDMLDWFFRREVGASHISIFLKEMSEWCQEESVSGMFGFCDPSFICPMTPRTTEEERSDYLSRIFGCNFSKIVINYSLHLIMRSKSVVSCTIAND